MAKIILARNAHDGIEQAERLMPLMRRANAISFETTGLLEDDARYTETAFNGGNTNLLESLNIEARMKVPYDSSAQYNLRVNEGIVENGLKMVLMDVWSPLEKIKHDQLMHKWFAKKETARSNFERGRFVSSRNNRLASAKAQQTYLDFRDDNLARQAVKAIRRAERIVAPEDLSYLVLLGHTHEATQKLREATECEVEEIILWRTKFEHTYAFNKLLQLMREGNYRTPETVRLAEQDLVASVLETMMYVSDSARAYASQHPDAKEILQIDNENWRQAHHEHVIACYVFRPMAQEIASRMNTGQIKALSKKLGKFSNKPDPEEVRREIYQNLKENGTSLPDISADSKEWDSYFPYEKARTN